MTNIMHDLKIEINKNKMLTAEEGDYYLIKDGLITFYRKNGDAYLIMPVENFRTIK